jgi:hypothetical protein
MKRKHQKGDVILIDYARDQFGGHWWIECSNPNALFRGPFRTEAEARRNAEIETLGPQCKIEEAGMWDPAWDRPQ